MTIIKMRNDSSGFTLIELMVVIIIASILMAVAVPSFTSIVKRNTAESLQTKVASAISTARTEAASRNVKVLVCASADGEDCITTAGAEAWNNGWIVFADRNFNDAFDEGIDELIDVFHYEGDYALRVQGAAGDIASFSFNPQGFLTSGTNILARVCDPENLPRYARGLYVNASGLVMKTRDGNNDGIHDDPRLVGTTGAANLKCD